MVHSVNECVYNFGSVNMEPRKQMEMYYLD